MANANAAGGRGELRSLMGMIANGETEASIRLLDETPDLARAHLEQGATRQATDDYVLAPINHYIYAGDTALHIAAVAYQVRIARALIERGADVAARNRRGAQPLHYACDGMPDTATWNPGAQREVVECLLEAGADPDAWDKSGTAPLHRAVRNRCAAAVRALLDGGADPRRLNSRGTSPMTLATQTTGRSGSGSPAAKTQQQHIIELLEQRIR